MASIPVLDVLLHGRPVGTLTLLPGERTLFAFDQGYVDDPARPTLSLGFKDSLGGLVTSARTTRVRVPPFFANMLPEGSMRDYLAKRAGVSPKREFFLLWALGEDLPGAVTIRHADGEDWPPDVPVGLDPEDRQRLETEGALRFSLAGIQLKFSAVLQASGGLTIPARGVGGDWIVKLPSARFAGVPENEHAMLLLAAQVGVDVPEQRLVSVEDIGGLPEGIARLGDLALAVKRFDRAPAGGKVHIEDFGQVFSLYPDDKYGRASCRNILEVLAVEADTDDVAEFIRRVVFNTLIGNADMHVKNWSLCYPDRVVARLSPAYDFVSTIAYLRDDEFALKYGRVKLMSQLSRAELCYLADKARLPRNPILEVALETVMRFRDAWRMQKADLPFTRDQIETIGRHADSVALARELA